MRMAVLNIINVSEHLEKPVNNSEHRRLMMYVCPVLLPEVTSVVPVIALV
jgi:hypothetical protein